MIEINLLPQHLRVKHDDRQQLILLAAAAVLAILVMLNVYVVSLAAVKELQLAGLKKKWNNLGRQREKVDQAMKLSSNLSQDALVLKQLVGDKVAWSFKLNRLSLLLPPGVWFNELSLKGVNFTLRGSVISLKKEEMAAINLFLNSLKQDRQFFGDFSGIELASVQRRLLGGFEISDFVLNGSLKGK